MRSLFIRLAVIGAIGILLFNAATLYRSRKGETRFLAARDRAAVLCKAARSVPEHATASNLCGDDAFAPKALPIYEDAKRDLDLANERLSARDRAGAEIALLRVATATERMQHIGSPVAAIASATLVERVLDVLAQHPRLDPTEATMTRLALDPADRVLRDMTAHRLWRLAHYNDAAGIARRSDTDLADAMEADERAFAAMERAIALRDVGACVRGAQTSSEAGAHTVMCAKLVTIAERWERLRNARGR